MLFKALLVSFITPLLFAFLWVLLGGPFFLLLIILGFGGIHSVCIERAKFSGPITEPAIHEVKEEWELGSYQLAAPAGN